MHKFLRQGNFYMGLYQLDANSAHRRLDIRCFEEREKGAALLHCTGSGVFNRYLQRVALEQDLQLSEKGLCPAKKLGQDSVIKTGAYLPLRSEEAIFAALNVVYREPHERSGKMDIISSMTGAPWFQNNAAQRSVVGLQLHDSRSMLALT